MTVGDPQLAYAVQRLRYRGWQAAPDIKNEMIDQAIVIVVLG
jgi:hypothetical protein